MKLKDRNRITQKEKDANKKQWYKDKVDSFGNRKNSTSTYFGDNNLIKKRINYKIFNGEIDTNDFKYITDPYNTNEELGLPADFNNKDIVSGKLKSLIGMEMKRPFSYKIVAVNEEATNRKEEEHFSKLKEWVYSQIMLPIETDIREKYQKELKGRDLSEEEFQALEKQVQEEIKTSTPEEVNVYMKRDHQDPAEVLISQLFNYSTSNVDAKSIFNEGFKHGVISAYEVYWVGEANNKPRLEVINPLNFDFDKSPDTKYIEDGEWCTYEKYMSPSEVISFFSDELTEKEIDKIYDLSDNKGVDIMNAFTDHPDDSRDKIPVLHTVWKSLKKIGILRYEEDGEIYTTIVDESHSIREVDRSIQWKWIPEVHEGYRIGTDIYKKLRPLEGQYKDINNLMEVKLSYYGSIYDNTNARPTSFVDRMKIWQYYYNIIMYRMERLMAADKGKVVMINPKLIPKSLGISLEKWMYYLDTLKIGFIDPTAEKTTTQDVSNAAKEIDLSTMSDLTRYINLAEYVEDKCGRTVGITPELEGQVEKRAAVGNTQSNMSMASNIVEPFFTFHDNIKKRTLEALVEQCKITYSKPEAIGQLTYILDDMSVQMLKVDKELLDNSTYGIFISNSSKAWEIKELIQQLSQAALQNDKADLSDIVKILRSDSLVEAEELLERAQEKSQEREMRLLEQQRIAQEEMFKQELQMEQTKHQFEMEEIQLKGKLDLEKQVVMSAGFNPDKDMNDNGELDILEIARKGVETDIKAKKQALDESKFQHEKMVDKEKLKLEEKKIKESNKKSNK